MVDIDSLSPLAQLIAGVLLLLLGRRLFWIFVGVIGFLAGLRFGGELAQDQPQVVILLIAFGLGLVGAILAVLLQRVAIALAGALAGGMLALRLAETFGFANEAAFWIIFLLGAVLAGILVSLLFDWALIVLSALIGANLLADAAPVDQGWELLLTALLAIAGILVQARLLAPPTGAPPPK